MHEFTADTPISMRISVPSGSVKIITEERENVSAVISPSGNNERSRSAAEDIEVSFDGDQLTIQAPQKSGRRFWDDASVSVEVHAPTDSSARINVASASVKCEGRYSQMQVNSASGDIEIYEVTGDVKIQAASGDIQISRVGGQLTANTASGDLKVTNVGGPVDTKTASGDIKIGDAGGDVHSNSASGDLRIDAVHTGTVSANSASGDVSVGVITGTGVWLDLNSKSGSINSDLDTSGDAPDTHELTVQIRTASGDIDILRSKQKAAV